MNDNTIPRWLVRQYERRADAERDAGGECLYDKGLPAISIHLSDGRIFYYQEHEAQVMLDEVPECMDPEDWFLAQAQNW